MQGIPLHVGKVRLFFFGGVNLVDCLVVKIGV